MWAILWTLWGYKVMVGLNILPFFPSKKQRLVVPSSDIFNDGDHINWIVLPLSFMQTHTHIYLTPFSLFSPTASLPSQPCVYSCCFIMYLIQLSWVSLRMGKNENLLTLCGCDSINIIQGHDFSLCIFLQLKAKLDLKTQISSGLPIGGKKGRQQQNIWPNM